ncbi:GNAT family N-acetyltransferase [Dialister sp.]|uniref:GNAT family N-acetyltransferase n=1 Tax=Dialister sp. TaxID=1955814 RepID=UPI003F0DCE5C
MITHNETDHIFEINYPEGKAYLEYTDDHGLVTVIHTIVPDALAGQGIAARLADAFYRWASENHYTIQSDCSYMTAWMKRHKIN